MTDGNLRDGVFHEFKKYGRIASVSVSMKNGERQAIVVYRKYVDIGSNLNKKSALMDIVCC